VASCLHDALVLYGRTVSPEEILPELLEDSLFYKASGGGITLSGGEPLMQADFCAELLALLKQSGVHCAVDTCGAVPWEAMEKVVPFVDLFLYDFKHPDSEAHKSLTGADNGLIKENLRRLGMLDIPVEIRIPLIPGMNTDEAALKRSAEFLAEIPSVTAVRLLEYHDLSRSKYNAIGRTCTMPANLRMTPDEMHRSADVFKSYHLKTVLPDD
jgi:pyruvate formate lyase activating enzyme